ncbi:acetyl-CoA C-acyltransferase [Zhongshania sp.]|jgi:acetyl-CoA C-acetyltransferase|uniref:acetyl-CoA C-acyltransferase n=1 Tax=Zhongshania sp. TaxID=1971902 RepID=UPI0039E63898
MQSAMIVDAVRIPRATLRGTSAYAALRPVELLRPLFTAIAERNHLDSSQVEDVLLGCATQSGGQGANVAKIAALYAGWSEAVSGVTVNRFCCSGLDAINLAASKIMSGMESVLVAGGVEQLSAVPMFADQGDWFSNPKVMKATKFMHMGLSADLIATQQGYSRERLDAYALQSHQRANHAASNHYFKQSLVPVCDSNNAPLLDRDNGVRAELSLEKLAALPASFADYVQHGQALVSQRYPDTHLQAHHSAGNSPALVDGASLLLLASESACKKLSLRPRARICHYANASDEPVKMLTGHLRATEKLLAATGLQASDIDLWEVNESFAASVLYFQDHFNIANEQLNVNGGAIAFGHPLGATGGNLMGMLLDELERRNVKRGIVAICGGAGVGVATLIERF